MPTSGRQPVEVPPTFWQRQDVTDALDARDIARLFRLLRQYCGASQARIGITVGMTQSTVSLIVNRNKPVTTIAVLERIADGLTMPDDSRMRLGLAPKETDIMRRRTALGLGLIGALSPGTLTSVLRDSAAEAFEFTRERAVTAVGKGSLDHLTSIIAELDGAYPWRPAAELFPIARVYRQRVEDLINGKHTLAEARELYVRGAYLSHILSDLAYDLGSTVTARAFAIDSYELADHAGHGELCAWAADSLAVVLREAGRTGEAAKAAFKGLRKVPQQHPLAARLHARAAQDYARAGDSTACNDALARAQEACDQLPATMPSRFSTDTAEHTAHSVSAYAASCHIALGDWRAAETQARKALGVARWSPGRAAGAHVDLGTALVHLGRLDEAIDHGEQGLGICERVGWRSSLSQLRSGRFLKSINGRYPKDPTATAFLDRYRQVAPAAITS